MLADLVEDYDLAYKNLEGCLDLSKRIGDKGMESMALAKKALIGDLIKPDSENLSDCKKALKLAQKISSMREASMALSCLGEIYLNRNKYRQAIKAFSNSLKLRLKLDQKMMATEAKTDICHLYLLVNKNKKAYELASEIAVFLGTGNLYGTDKPILMFYICYQALKVNGDPKAETVLTMGLNYLQETIDKIPDDEFMQKYTNISYIHELKNNGNSLNWSSEN